MRNINELKMNSVYSRINIIDNKWISYNCTIPNDGKRSNLS
jgi:hypothetical protein